MSRTTRTTPRWVQREVTHTNNLLNGYRGIEFTYYGRISDYVNVNGVTIGTPVMSSHGEGPTDTARNEENSWLFSTDNYCRPLRYCKNSCEIGKSDGWMMSEGSSTIAKRWYRRQWARDNRRWSKKVTQEELNDYYSNDDDDVPMLEADEEWCYADDYVSPERDDPMQTAYKHGYSAGYMDGYNAALALYAGKTA